MVGDLVSYKDPKPHTLAQGYTSLRDTHQPRACRVDAKKRRQETAALDLIFSTSKMTSQVPGGPAWIRYAKIWYFQP